MSLRHPTQSTLTLDRNQQRQLLITLSRNSKISRGNRNSSNILSIKDQQTHTSHLMMMTSNQEIGGLDIIQSLYPCPSTWYRHQYHPSPWYLFNALSGVEWMNSTMARIKLHQSKFRGKKDHSSFTIPLHSPFTTPLSHHEHQQQQMLPSPFV